MYKDKLTEAMTWLGQQPNFLSVGYNLCKSGGEAGGTMRGVPEDKRIEMPLAEALMAGVANGLALDGHVVLLWVERADFLLHASDQIVNALDKLDRLSKSIHKPGVIVRVNVGNSREPLFTGPCHTADNSEAFRSMVSFPVHCLTSASNIVPAYKDAYIRACNGIPSMIFEYKDLHNT